MLLTIRKLELLEDLVVQVEPEEPEELVVTEEVTTNLNQTVLLVQAVQAVLLVQAVVITETTLELEDKVVLEVLEDKVVPVETAVATVKQETKVLLETKV